MGLMVRKFILFKAIKNTVIYDFVNLRPFIWYIFQIYLDWMFINHSFYKYNQVLRVGLKIPFFNSLLKLVPIKFLRLIIFGQLSLPPSP